MSITKNVPLNWYSSMKKKIEKDSDNFWHRKLTLKVRNWHFSIAWFRLDVDLIKFFFYEKVLFFTQLSYHLMCRVLKKSYMLSNTHVTLLKITLSFFCSQLEISEDDLLDLRYIKLIEKVTLWIPLFLRQKRKLTPDGEEGPNVIWQINTNWRKGKMQKATKYFVAIIV